MQDLLRLVEDEGYRRARLGLEKVRSGGCRAGDVGRVGLCVGRPYASALHTSCHRLPHAPTPPLCALPSPPPPLRAAPAQVDWRAFGQHFGRSYESVSYKYSYVKNTGRTGHEAGTKAKHAKAKHETSYKEMAIFALQQVRRVCVCVCGGGGC